MKRGSKRRYEDLDDSYDQKPVEIVGLKINDLYGEVMGPHYRLVSKFITTRIGVNGEGKSRSLFHQLPLGSDFSHPITMVRY